MTVKELHQILDRLDSCMDQADHPEVLLALNFIRRGILKCWQANQCCTIDMPALVAELVSLSLLCMKGTWHPALPLALCRVILRLCTPVFTSKEAIREDCWRHADLIRLLRAWLPVLEAVLIHYDAPVKDETHQLMQHESEMLDEVFAQGITLYRRRVKELTLQRRQTQAARLAFYRQAMDLPALVDQVTVITYTREKMEEENFLCTAEMY